MLHFKFKDGKSASNFKKEVRDLSMFGRGGKVKKYTLKDLFK